jgi:hypothetical protein
MLKQDQDVLQELLIEQLLTNAFFFFAYGSIFMIYFIIIEAFFRIKGLEFYPDFAIRFGSILRLFIGFFRIFF